MRARFVSIRSLHILDQIQLTQVLFLSLPLRNSTPREGNHFPRKYCMNSWLVISPLLSFPPLSSFFFPPHSIPHSHLITNSRFSCVQTGKEGNPQSSAAPRTFAYFSGRSNQQPHLLSVECDTETACGTRLK